MDLRKISASIIVTVIVMSILLSVTPVKAAMSAAASPSSGPVGTKVTITGSGVSHGGKIEAYWENLGGPKLNETYATGAGDFSIVVYIPEATAGSHYVIIRDVSTGETYGVAFVIKPKITISPARGIPGDQISVTGNGFAANKDVTLKLSNTTHTWLQGKNLTVTPLPPKTDSKGTFSAVFTIPAIKYGSYTLNATDDGGNHNATTLIVGAAITLTPTSGPSGTVVSISGRGFTPNSNITVAINMSATKKTVPSVSPIKTGSDGTFTGQIVIPTFNVGTATINATDGTYWATASFKVTGSTKITVTPSSGPPGFTVSISGSNFTAIANTPVTVKFGALTVATLYTDAAGKFTGTFTVPSLPTTGYTVTATDKYGLENSTSFTIALTLIVISPTSAPCGANITVTGYGFTGAHANITIGTLMVRKNVPVSNLSAGKAWFIIPSLPKGGYTVKVRDSDGLEASTTITITDETKLMIEPSSAPRGYNIAIKGYNFVPNKNVDVVLYNASGTVRTWTVTAQSNGSFTILSFTIPPNYTLGEYKLNATSVYDFDGLGKLVKVTMVPFKVVVLTMTIYPLKSSYAQGDAVAFYIKCVMQIDGDITIKDPSGYLYKKITIGTLDWVAFGTEYVVPYEKTIVQLTEDAPTGTWKWDSTFGESKSSGTFIVTEKPTMASLSTKIDELTSLVNTLNKTISSLQAAITSLSKAVSDISSAIQNVASVANAAKSAADSAASAASAAKSAADSAVSAASAAKSAAESAVSAADAARSAAENAANIAQSAVSAADAAKSAADNAASAACDAAASADAAKSAAEGVALPVWIAVVLSLVAAVAAIVAVITIRGKIAG